MAEGSAIASGRTTRVGVVEEHDILRYGLAASLSEDGRLEVVAAASPELLDDDELDIAVVSSASAERHRFNCPIVVVSHTTQHPRTVEGGNDVAGALHRATVTLPQLLATVHAAAAGLRVEEHGTSDAVQLDPRAVQLVELIADGQGTREIAEAMNYSERTIKKLITELELALGARSRAQIVAHAIRRGLI
jgi:DNA-binding NarL/FixJ family response regulator